MAEIKRNFARGKMNKDVDERLVPNGEYRDAMNIQVSTSEGSDVGAIENLLGNKKITIPSISNDSTCVGSIADEKNDALYWFVREEHLPNQTISEARDIIFQYKNQTVTYVFVDVKNPMVACYGLQAPASGNIVINSQAGFDAITVGDKFTLAMPGWDGDEQYTVLSKDPTTLMINIGDYTNATWANFQTSGPGEIQITLLLTDAVLNFSEKTITGINIIDDLLFWTDNATEPKVINIPRSIEGTNPTGLQHTLLINEEQNITTSSGIDIQEEHITVIKKSPKTVLSVEAEDTLQYAEGTTVTTQDFLVDTNSPQLGNKAPTQTVEFHFTYGSNSPLNLPVNVGDTILLAESTASVLPPDFSSITLKLVEKLSSGPNDVVPGVFHTWLATIVSISASTQTTGVQYNWATRVDSEQRFLEKFPRFSYRYKYIDGNYSTFAPFTSVIFKPGSFLYDVKDAFNLGMENRISKITLRDYDSNLPKDVAKIDLLYKDSNSPTIHLINTLNPDSLEWNSSNMGFEVKPNMVRAVIPENQMLRPWDNVPRKALAQSITGSRLVYGNYLQNYTGGNYKISAELTNRSVCDYDFGNKSLKSIRNYSLGISYLDNYGRQTPVFTNKAADIDISIKESVNQNQIVAQPLSAPPSWATHYKVFIKETSNEYYNLAMDRIYEAKDGNIWISFPSSDRNKVDEETFLILKKSVEDFTAVQAANRYKILAIENEAPEFIKTKIQLLDETGTPPTTWFPNSSGFPLIDSPQVIIDKDLWDSSKPPLSDFDLLSVKFCTVTGIGGAKACTPYYDIIANTIVGTPGQAMEYHLKLNKPIKEDWLSDPIGSTSQMDATLSAKVYRRVVENGPEFDGRFFVKIARDPIIEETIFSQASVEFSEQYVTTGNIPFYYLADGNAPTTTNDTTLTAHNQNGDSDTLSDWEDNFDPSTTVSGSPQSMWFIDEAYYAGYYTVDANGYNYLDDIGMYARGPQVAVPTGTVPETTYHPNSTHFNHPTARETGYNKGIYTENGQTYIDLSFGYIKASGAADDPHMHTDVDNNGAAWDAFNNSTGVGNIPVWTVYYEDLRDTDEDDGNFKFWSLGTSLNSHHNTPELTEQIMHLQAGQKFKFLGDGDTIYTITGVPTKKYHVNFMNHVPIDDHWLDIFINDATSPASYLAGTGGSTFQADMDYNFSLQHLLGNAANKRTTWKIPIDKDPTDQSITLYNPIDQSLAAPANATTQGGIQFVEKAWVNTDGQVVGSNPAIWETEPKEDIDLDIFYEVDGTFPLTINNDTNYTFAPIGSVITSNDVNIFPNTTVVGWNNNVVEASSLMQGDASQVPGQVTFHRPDGSCVTAIVEFMDDGNGNSTIFSFKANINPNVSNNPVNLSWFNCYSWGNGVESNRIRDDYNQVFIDKGAKASSTIEEPYKEEHRKYGLIYSGLYNSTSGVNNLNQFIQAEKITKDINPTYGSIQKLHARDTDLIALCEDKILKILSNKDAVFNADGNPQLTATSRVLGQTVPFVGEFGISKNPESFASESYRVYFTDKARGSVMRLSMDGLTPISMHGMKDWFKDNLKLNNTIIGSYDDKKGEYNVTLQQTNEPRWQNGPITVSFREDSKGWVSFKSFVPEIGISCANEYYTFDKGIPWRHHVENADRNTFYNLPHDSSVNVLLNQVPGSVKSFTTLNYEGSQSRIDQFVADPTTGLTDGEYYNLQPDIPGWYVDRIFTDLETGSLNEFIDKEGKWFNYIKGENVQHDLASNVLMNTDGSSTFDQASFAIQGLGVLNSLPTQISFEDCTDPMAFNYNSNATISCGSCCVPVLMGCLEPSAFNWAPGVPNNTDDESCIWRGCTCDPIAFPDGCTNTTTFPTVAFSYVNNGVAGAGIIDDSSCIAVVYGCTDPNAFNHNPLANINETSPTDPTDPCIPVFNGCTIPSADNYNSSANTDDGTCTWYGCLAQPSAPNYGYNNPLGGPNIPWSNTQIGYGISGASYGPQDDGTCLGGGCTNPSYPNFDITALWDDGSCIACDFSASGTNAYNGVPITTIIVDATSSTAANGSIQVVPNQYAPHTPYTYTITDSNGGSNYGSTGNGPIWTFHNLPTDTYTISLVGNNGICTFDTPNVVVGVTVTSILGCTSTTACNYDPAVNANVDDGSCEYTSCAGCMDPTASTTLFGGYNMQTNSLSSCLFPGTLNPGSCTIACGDGNDATSWGNYCCTYDPIPGCTHPDACNYDSTATVDDGSCEYTSCAGCLDSTAGNHCSSCTIACDYNNPGNQCCTATPVDGCTDSNACNHDPSANIDDGSCVYGFDSISVGDPNQQDSTGTYLSAPSYFESTPMQTTLTHWIGGAVSTTPYAGAQPYMIYPADTANEQDIGLSFRSKAPSMATQYGHTGDKIHMVLRKYNNNVWVQVDVKVWNNPDWSTVNNILGDRINTNPYPFGSDPSGSNNYNFDIYATSGSKQQYRVELFSTIDGATYGQMGQNAPNCGASHTFTFTTVPECSSPYASSGCTNSGACNYDSTATCDDGSCYYCTTACWDCVNSGPPGFNWTMQQTLNGCCSTIPGLCQYTSAAQGYADPTNSCELANVTGGGGGETGGGGE